MGLKVIVEQSISNYFKKFINSLIKTSDTSSQSILDLNKTIKSINPESTIDLSDITKGYKTIDDYPEIEWNKVVEDLINSQQGKKYSDIFYSVLEDTIETHEVSKKLKMYSEFFTDRNELSKLAQESPEKIKRLSFIFNDINNSLKTIFSNQDDVIKIVKNISGLTDDNLNYLDELVKGINNNVELTLSSNLKNQKLDISKKFREKWFSMMKKVENRLGQKWQATDEEKQQLDNLLTALNKKTKGEEIYFTLPITGKTVKIEPQEILNTQLSNYKLIYNKDGSVSSLNKIDTHTQDSVNLFFDYINRQSNAEDIIRNINEQMEKGEITKIEEVLSKMESDNSFWDDIIENGDDVTKKIAETTATGTAREQLVASNAKKLFGNEWEVEFQAYDGHPLDRLLGIDLVLKNAAGEYKFVQVKSVNSVNVYEAEFGVVAKMYNKDLKLQKPSQLDNIVYVSPKNEVVVASKNRILKYSKELEDLIPTDKVGFKGPNMYGYSELIVDTYVVIEDSPKGTILVKTK